MTGRLPDDKLRCPRCRSANILSSPLGQRQCEDCKHTFGFKLPEPRYAIDRHGNHKTLGPLDEARHKAALAKAAGLTPPLVMGIDPQFLRDVLSQCKEMTLTDLASTPWWRPDLRIKYKAFAAAYSGVAEQFTGKPL